MWMAAITILAYLPKSGNKPFLLPVKKPPFFKKAAFSFNDD